MRLRHRLLSGVVLLVTLVSSRPTVAQLIEQKIGDMGRTTLLTLHVFTEGGPQGGLSFRCKEGRGNLKMHLLMSSYRLKNSNRGPCHYAAVTLLFDGDLWEPLVLFRPRSLNAAATFVTSHAQKDSSCLDMLGLPYDMGMLGRFPDRVLNRALSTQYMRAIISDMDRTKWGSSQITEGPPMLFNLESVRSALIELQNRCREKK